MSFQRFAIAVLALASVGTVVSYPPIGSKQSPEIVHHNLPDASESTHQVYAPDMLLSIRTPPSNSIRCYAPVRHTKTPTIDGCRPTLNEIRRFPNYRVTQFFEDNKWPKEPTTPPFALHHFQSDCIVRLGTNDPRRTDRFSFYDFREIATEIVERCHEFGAVGGHAPIGRGVGWMVSVLGIRDAPLESIIGNGTLGLFDIGSKNGTDIL